MNGITFESHHPFVVDRKSDCVKTFGLILDWMALITAFHPHFKWKFNIRLTDTHIDVCISFFPSQFFVPLVCIFSNLNRLRECECISNYFSSSLLRNKWVRFIIPQLNCQKWIWDLMFWQFKCLLYFIECNFRFRSILIFIYMIASIKQFHLIFRFR